MNPENTVFRMITMHYVDRQISLFCKIDAEFAPNSQVFGLDDDSMARCSYPRGSVGRLATSSTFRSKSHRIVVPLFAVLVAHRLSTVVNADSICVVDKGLVLEQGNHDELVANGGIHALLAKKRNHKKADLLD